MSAKTKIVVFHLKELVYTGIFVILGILFLILLLIMLIPQKEPVTGDSESTMALYVPGVYTTSLDLNDMAVDIEIVVDADYIHSMRLIHLDDAVTTMYPLIGPAFENLSEQIIEAQSIDTIVFDQDTRYTTQVLMEVIQKTLLKAQTPLEENQ